MKYLKEISEYKNVTINDYLNLINKNYNLTILSDRITKNIKRYDLSIKVGLFASVYGSIPGLYSELLLMCSFDLGEINFNILNSDVIYNNDGCMIIDTDGSNMNKYSVINVENNLNRSANKAQVGIRLSLDNNDPVSSFNTPEDIVLEAFNFLKSEYDFTYDYKDFTNKVRILKFTKTIKDI